jgi:hypothetical protein
MAHLPLRLLTPSHRSHESTHLRITRALVQHLSRHVGEIKIAITAQTAAQRAGDGNRNRVASLEGHPPPTNPSTSNDPHTSRLREPLQPHPATPFRVTRGVTHQPKPDVSRLASGQHEVDDDISRTRIGDGPRQRPGSRSAGSPDPHHVVQGRGEFVSRAASRPERSIHRIGDRGLPDSPPTSRSSTATTLTSAESTSPVDSISCHAPATSFTWLDPSSPRIHAKRA